MKIDIQFMSYTMKGLAYIADIAAQTRLNCLVVQNLYATVNLAKVDLVSNKAGDRKSVV